MGVGLGAAGEDTTTTARLFYFLFSTPTTVVVVVVFTSQDTKEKSFTTLEYFFYCQGKMVETKFNVGMTWYVQAGCLRAFARS